MSSSKRLIRSCTNCGKQSDKHRKCPCHLAFYCNRACQVDHWKKHKAECRYRQAQKRNPEAKVEPKPSIPMRVVRACIKEYNARGLFNKRGLMVIDSKSNDQLRFFEDLNRVPGDTVRDYIRESVDQCNLTNQMCLAYMDQHNRIVYKRIQLQAHDPC